MTLYHVTSYMNVVTCLFIVQEKEKEKRKGNEIKNQIKENKQKEN